MNLDLKLHIDEYAPFLLMEPMLVAAATYFCRDQKQGNCLLILKYSYHEEISVSINDLGRKELERWFFLMHDLEICKLVLLSIFHESWGYLWKWRSYKNILPFHVMTYLTLSNQSFVCQYHYVGDHCFCGKRSCGRK